MKLLPKSDILIKKAQDQKQAVDEGKKLAQKVDTLRELAANEEASLDKFRSETLEQIHKETTEAATKRDALLGEVRELESAKREALQPLTRELELIDEAREELAQKAAHNATQALTIDAREQSISAKEKEVGQTLLRVETKEEAVTRKLADIINTETDTKQLNQTAIRLMEEADSIRTKLSTELVHREEQCSSNEKRIILREQQLEADKSALVKEWRLLADRKAVHERNINRLKK